MKFIPGVFKVLKDTTWPSRAQRWKDYLSVLEYTFFFTVVIYLFDKLISFGVVELLALCQL
ncbi:preprotein translocase subunit SecE [Streptococcus loxodontisalivarius]|uniref:Preprotein translocase subunit SecE n=1 Tax=Streptococcus loxodontisalivarius TaxID=1349415 RepID=A0ABS2PQP1_9STRE|nr:preprotein translocase subunit SecE [Streptococcus loxodontisalivarius]